VLRLGVAPKVHLPWRVAECTPSLAHPSVHSLELLHPNQHRFLFCGSVIFSPVVSWEHGPAAVAAARARAARACPDHLVSEPVVDAGTVAASSVASRWSGIDTTAVGDECVVVISTVSVPLAGNGNSNTDSSSSSSSNNNNNNIVIESSDSQRAQQCDAACAVVDADAGRLACFVIVVVGARPAAPSSARAARSAQSSGLAQVGGVDVAVVGDCAERTLQRQ
jgi:hypothetical protein